jgi:tRNA-splicing endonuclease subunit Sen34
MAAEVSLPVPISLVSGRYLIFSSDAVTYLRREHHICGVFTGTLPQAPQQNVFLGLPLQLMPEETKLLVDKGVARIVDDYRYHNDAMRLLLEQDKRKYLEDLSREGQTVSQFISEKKEQQREKALQKVALKAAQKAAARSSSTQAAGVENDEETLFELPPRPDSAMTNSSSNVSSSMSITPSTTVPLLPAQPPAEYNMHTPKVPTSYAVFAHLHSQGYFLSPGLRFGCQYMAYPGDPLRFHSHFLVYGFERDQKVELMEIVSGGRLGTGVKKGFLLGFAAEPDDCYSEVRTFSIEWAGM